MLGAGGGRTSSTTMANTSNGVLYGVFVFSAILSGTMLNTVGPRLTMLCGDFARKSIKTIISVWWVGFEKPIV